ncbi:hypothetical protein AB0U16_22860, partial [Escherichia coli]
MKSAILWRISRLFSWAVTIRNDSLAARTDTWLQSFLVWSPGQRDIIKTVALVLMVL